MTRPAKTIIPGVVTTKDGKAAITNEEHTPFDVEKVEASDVANPDLVAKQFFNLKQDIAAATRGARSDWKLDSMLHKDITIAPGVTVTIQHRLGREYRTWEWLRPRTSAPALVEQTSDDPIRHLLVKNTGASDVTVDIVVY